MLLRIVVGYHFHKEGTNKLKSGTFSSSGFLAGAKGPFAPYFKRMLDDPDGLKKLCIQESISPDGTKSYSIDPELTFAIWDQGFADEATSYYGFGSEELQLEIAQRRDKLAGKIKQARESKDKTVDTAELERQRAIDEQNILRIREQPARLEEILKDHEQQLLTWMLQIHTGLIQCRQPLCEPPRAWKHQHGHHHQGWFASVVQESLICPARIIIAFGWQKLASIPLFSPASNSRRSSCCVSVCTGKHSRRLFP